ncbi:survival protein sure-like phosphatase/nucleotidase [Chytridium lagenaria]|nr:survival protein sure-like phosphatase/nucleotidase [Chytridium lagenaria]
MSVSTTTAARPPPRLVLITNDDGPPGTFSPFLMPFLAALKDTLGWNVRVVIPDTQKSWIGKGFTPSAPVSPTYYHAVTGRTYTHAGKIASRIPDDEFYTLLNSTPAACVNIALNHIVNMDEVDLIVSGPNLGRNSSAGSTLSSGTIGGALEASLLGKKAVAFSFAFDSRQDLANPDSLSNACTTSLHILQTLWTQWPSKDSPSYAELYNINVPLVPPPMRPIIFTTFQPGGYASLFARDEKTETPTYTFRPTFPGGEWLVEGSDSSTVFQKLVSVTPMYARFHGVEVDLAREQARMFGGGGSSL